MSAATPGSNGPNSALHVDPQPPPHHHHHHHHHHHKEQPWVPAVIRRKFENAYRTSYSVALTVVLIYFVDFGGTGFLGQCRVG